MVAWISFVFTGRELIQLRLKKLTYKNKLTVMLAGIGITIINILFAMTTPEAI